MRTIHCNRVSSVKEGKRLLKCVLQYCQQKSYAHIHTHTPEREKESSMFATSQSLVQTPPNPPGGGGGGAIGADGDTPRNPFSISVILSDEVGQKRSPPSNSVTPRSFPSISVTPLSRNERPRHPSSQESTAERASSHSIGQLFHTPSRSAHQGGGEGGRVWGQRMVGPPRVTSAEAANSTKSPSTNTGLLDGKYMLAKS